MMANSSSSRSEGQGTRRVYRRVSSDHGSRSRAAPSSSASASTCIGPTASTTPSARSTSSSRQCGRRQPTPARRTSSPTPNRCVSCSCCRGATGIPAALIGGSARHPSRRDGVHDGGRQHPPIARQPDRERDPRRVDRLRRADGRRGLADADAGTTHRRGPRMGQAADEVEPTRLIGSEMKMNHPVRARARRGHAGAGVPDVRDRAARRIGARRSTTTRCARPSCGPGSATVAAANPVRVGARCEVAPRRSARRRRPTG